MYSIIASRRYTYVGFSDSMRLILIGLLFIYSKASSVIEYGSSEKLKVISEVCDSFRSLKRLVNADSSNTELLRDLAGTVLVQSLFTQLAPLQLNTCLLGWLSHPA